MCSSQFQKPVCHRGRGGGVRRESRSQALPMILYGYYYPPPWASLEKETQTADRQLGQNLIASLSLKNIKLHK